MSRKVILATPGEILSEEFLKPMGVSQYALAQAIGVPRRRINEIVLGKRSITADTALRLAAFFGTDAQSWMNLQTHYDIERARESVSKFLKTVIPVTPVTKETSDSSVSQA
ncbi:MAG: HigA family addiction module antidote protein [Rhizobacter sp.]|nr:HigA family addiction module antidote protein [Burkholderiales bacterium]